LLLKSEVKMLSMLWLPSLKSANLLIPRSVRTPFWTWAPIPEAAASADGIRKQLW
jgi:hypothetical protein